MPACDFSAVLFMISNNGFAEIAEVLLAEGLRDPETSPHGGERWWWLPCQSRHLFSDRLEAALFISLPPSEKFVAHIWSLTS